MTLTPDYRLGILGHPLHHTLSPVLHRHFLACCGLAGDYLAYDVPPVDLSDWLMSPPALALNGWNVTIPHKMALLAKVATLSDAAKRIGAVNTVIRQSDGTLHGENTDVLGFVAPLSESTLANLRGGHAVVLGAGGASRAVAYGLLQAGVTRLSFVVRDIGRAQATLALAEAIRPGVAVATTDIASVVLGNAAVLVNTTPLGMRPDTQALPLDATYLAALPAQCIVYDLIYNPLETRLLAAARISGLPVQDGLEMLIHQGAAAFALWTGQTLPAPALQAARGILLDALSA